MQKQQRWIETKLASISFRVWQNQKKKKQNHSPSKKKLV